MVGLYRVTTAIMPGRDLALVLACRRSAGESDIYVADRDD